MDVCKKFLWKEQVGMQINTKDIELSASMMCADYACLRDEVKNL